MIDKPKLKEGTHFTQKSFPCKQCGASLVFCADTDSLKCEYCGVENKITPPALPIHEYDLKSAIKEVEHHAQDHIEVIKDVKCPSCASTFEMDMHLRSTNCPYCSNPVVTNMDIYMPLSPESMLPFDINQKEAKEIFKKWVGNLWFAPSELKKFTEANSKFRGIYLPYWTYDSDTTSRYYGLRGDVYYEREYRRVFIDGREQTIAQDVAKIRWTPASGVVKEHFDDVLIGATLTIPRKLIDSLEPWDLKNLVSYDERFLSGFDSELYQVALNDGFNYAQNYMEYVIREAVRYQIGGDKQQINDLKIYHENTSFKYILLPIWTAHFKHKSKDYRFAINARSGVIQGERPYSKTKIFFAILAGILLIAGIFFAFENLERGEGFGGFNGRSGGFYIEIR